MPTKEQIRKEILALVEGNKKSGLKGQDLYSSILTAIINGKVDIGLSTEFALDKMKPIEEYRLFVDTVSTILNDSVTVEEIVGEPLNIENINNAKTDVANIVYNNEKSFAYNEKTEEENKKSLTDDLKVFEDNQKKLLEEYKSEDPIHDFNSFLGKAKEIADFEDSWALISTNPEFNGDIATKAEQDRQKANEKINEFCSLYNLSTNSNSVEKYSDITLLCHIVKSGDKDRVKSFFDAKTLLNEIDINNDEFKDSAKNLNEQFIKMADADYYGTNKNQIIQDIATENIKINKLTKQNKELMAKETELDGFFGAMDKLTNKAKGSSKFEDIKGIAENYNKANEVLSDIDKVTSKNKHFENLVIDSKKLNDDKFFKAMEDTLHLSAVSQEGKDSECLMFAKIVKEGNQDKINAFVEIAKNRYFAKDELNLNSVANDSLDKMTTLMENLVTAEGETLKENINQIANYKKEINGKAKEILGKTIMDEMADSFKIIKDNVALLDGKNKADFFAFNNLSKYSRAMSKWYALVDPLKNDFNNKINTDTKNLSDYVVKNFPEGANLKFGDPVFIMSLNPSSLMLNGKIVEKLTEKLISEADTETIVKMKDEATSYIYPVDNEKFYEEKYGKGLDIISANIKTAPLSKEEKENFDKAVEFLKEEKSFDNDKIKYDENILDSVSDCEGILTKDYVDSLNLPFELYDTTKEDFTINLIDHQSEDFAAEYVFDEMWIEESTQNDIKAVIQKATELGLMENAAGGESGAKEYGFAEYSKYQTKLNDLIDEGTKLTKPEEIIENVKNVTKTAEELKECKGKYEELFDFIGDKFGEGMSGNIFSNRQPDFPKEWRTGDRNRQMAQFNAICQLTYFTKEMNIPLDEMLSDPITSYRKSINNIHTKLLDEQFNAKESLGKKMAGYLTTKDSYEGQYMGISGRMLEALSKLEKKPENRVHNNMVSTLVSATYSLRMDKDAITKFTSDEPDRIAQYNIRNIFLVGDNTYDLADAAPDGYNPIEGKFGEVNYYEGIKNKETTPQQELDNILKAVIEYGPAADKLILVDDPDSEEKELALDVTKYLFQSEIRYHAQQYFADYVVLKGYKKGSPEYKLLEDYMQDPAKVENEYRKKNGIKQISISESEVNVDVKICQDKLGNRFAEYENPGVTFITKHEKQDQNLKDFYKSKTKLTDKVFNGKGTDKDEAELEKVNNDIAKLTATLTEELTSAFEKGEITERYYNDRMNNLVTGDFSKKATMFEKTLTKAEFAKLENNVNLSKENLTVSYNAYLESKDKEKLDFIKERDQKQYYVSKKLTPYQVEQRAKLKTLSNQYKVLQNKEASLNEAVKELDKLSKEIKTNNVDSIKKFIDKYEEINGLRGEISNLPGKNKHFENLVLNTGKVNDSVFKNVMENTLHIDTKQVGGKSEADLLVKLSRERKDQQISALVDAAIVRKQASEISDIGLQEHCSLLISQISPDVNEWEKNKSYITTNIISNREILKKKMSDDIVKMISEEKAKLDLIYAKYKDKEEFYKINNTYEIAKSFEKIGQFTENYDVVNHFDKISIDGTKDCVDIIKKEFPDSNVNSLIFARKNPDRNINALKIIVPASEKILSHMNYDAVAKCYNNMKNWTFSIEDSKEYTLSGEKSISELKKNGSLLPLTKNEKEELSSSLDYLKNNLLLASNKVTDTDENLINEEVTLKEAKYAKEEVEETKNFPVESVMPGTDFAFKSQLADFESITPYIGQDFVIEEKTKSNILEVIEKAEELGILDSNGGSEQIKKGYGFSKYLEAFSKAQKAIDKNANISDKYEKAENAKEIIKASNELESINKKYDELIDFIGDRFGDSLAGNVFTNREKEFPKRFREKAAKQCGQFNAIAQIYMCCKSEGVDIKEFLKAPVKTAYNKTVESKELYSKNVLHNDLNSTGKRMAYFLTDHTNISSLNDIKKSTINFGFNSNSLMRGLEAIVKLDTNPNAKAHNTVISAAARLLPAMAGYRSNDIFGNHIENGKQYDSKKFIKNIFAMNDQNEIKDIGNASPYYYNISDKTAKSVDYISEIKDNENTPKEEVNKVLGIISDYSDELANAIKEAKEQGVYGGNISVGEIIYHAHEYLTDYMIYNQIVPGSPEHEQINNFFKNPVASINGFRKEKGQGPLSENVVKEFKDELKKNGSRLNLIDGTIEDADHQINIQLKVFSDRKNELMEMLAENPDNENAENELMLISETVNGIITNRINEINNLPDTVSQAYKDARIKAYENEDFSESKYQDFKKAYYENIFNNISSDDYDNNYMIAEGLTEKQKEAREKNIEALNDKNEILEEMDEILQGAQSFADDNIAIEQVKDHFMLQDEITLSDVSIFINDIAKGNIEIHGVEKGDITKDEVFDSIYYSVKPLLIGAGVLDLEALSNNNKDFIRDTSIQLFDPEFAQDKFLLSLYNDHVKGNMDVIAASKAGHDDLMEIAGSHDINAASQATDEFAGKTMKEKQNLMIHKVAQLVCEEGYYPNQPTEKLDIYSFDEKIHIQAMYMQELLDFTATYNKVEPHKISSGASFGANLMPDDFKPGGIAYQRVKDEIDLVRINQFIKDNLDGENTEIYNSVMQALVNGNIELNAKIDMFDDAQFDKYDKIVKEQLKANGIDANIPEDVKKDVKDSVKTLQDPNRLAEDLFVNGFGPNVTDYYDVRKSFRSKNQYNSVGAGNINASVKVIKDLTAVNGKEAREAIIAGYFADLLEGKKIFEGQPEPLSQNVIISDKALSYGEYLFELISSSQEFNKIEPTKENSVLIDCFGTGISNKDAFAMGSKLFNKATEIINARNAEKIKEEKEQRSRIQRAKYEEIMNDMILYEQIDSISNQISENHHIFGGDNDYTPFENAAKNFNESLKKDRQHFNENAFKDMTDTAKEFMRVKFNKALNKYNEASYQLFISKHAQEDKIALKEAKRLGEEEYQEKKNEIDARNKAEKTRIEAKRYNDDAKKQMVERCLSETEYERYSFAGDMIALKEVLQNNGVINMIENVDELKNENSVMTYNDKSDDLLTIGKAEKIMDMEFNVGKTNSNFILPETEFDNIDLEPNELNNANNNINLDDFDKGLDESYKISEKKENVNKDHSLLIEEIEDEKEEINIDKKNEDLKAKLGKEFGNNNNAKSKEFKKGDNELKKDKVKEP